MPPRSIGVLIIAAGVALIVVGLLVASGGLAWFGRLPGDIRVERPNFRLYVPITSMLLLSLVLGIVSWLIRRLS
jgi:membrane protein implicated in regulation of membrane protease activity